MSKGQHLTHYQKGIVNRYYEHLDTITIMKLAESVGELYLATDKKKADKLWLSVEKALDKTSANDAAIHKIVATRDVKGLAELVGRLQKK